MKKIKEFLVACFQVCAVVGIAVSMQFVIWHKKNCVTLGNQNIQSVTICKDGLLKEEFTYTLRNNEVLELKINVKNQYKLI